MWIIKWVEMDFIYNYYPKVRFANTYDKAKEIQAELEAENEDQESEEYISELFEGKIMSEIYVEEIEPTMIEGVENGTE
jgi:ribosomal protein L15